MEAKISGGTGDMGKMMAQLQQLSSKLQKNEGPTLRRDFQPSDERAGRKTQMIDTTRGAKKRRIDDSD